MEKLNQKNRAWRFSLQKRREFLPAPTTTSCAPGEISETEKQEDNQNETVLVTKLFVLRDRTKMWLI